MMQYRIETITPRLLVGKRLRMSFAPDRTFELWRSFMPRRKEVMNTVSPDFYSVKVYDSPAYFSAFNPATEFDKWATMHVTDFSAIPAEMEPFTLPGGMYAVFNYKGRSSDGEAAYRYIFTEWLPASGYQLDNRPHFEIMGEKYKHDSPDSEEEIWVPVR